MYGISNRVIGHEVRDRHNVGLGLVLEIGLNHHKNYVMPFHKPINDLHVVLWTDERHFVVDHCSDHPHEGALTLVFLDTVNETAFEKDGALETGKGMVIEKLKHEFWIDGQRWCHLLNAAT